MSRKEADVEAGSTSGERDGETTEMVTPPISPSTEDPSGAEVIGNGSSTSFALRSDAGDRRGRNGPRSERAYVSIGQSTLGHLWLVVAIVLVGVIGGAALGVLRPPQYTAEARLLVGKTESLTNLAAVAGLAPAADQIASDYSRLVTTNVVVKDASRRIGRRGSLGGSLSASPIINSPIIRVDATASSAGKALALANAGSAALIDAVNQVNTESNSTIAQVVNGYRATDVQLSQAKAALTAAQNQLAGLQGAIKAGTGTPTAAEQAQLTSLQSQVSADQSSVDTLTLQSNALAQQYQSSVSPVQAETEVIESVGPAASHGSDRLSFLEISLLAGLIGGLIVGVAVASYVDIRALRRRGPRSRHTTARG